MMTKTLVLKSPAATGCLSLRTQPATASIPDNLLTLSSPTSDSLLHLFTFTLLPGLFMLWGTGKWVR